MTAVALVDDAAAQLAGPGQLAVVGVELLVEQHEAAQPLRLGQARVDPLDLAGEQLETSGLRRQVW